MYYCLIPRFPHLLTPLIPTMLHLINVNRRPSLKLSPSPLHHIHPPSPIYFCHVNPLNYIPFPNPFSYALIIFHNKDPTLWGYPIFTLHPCTHVLHHSTSPTYTCIQRKIDGFHNTTTLWVQSHISKIIPIIGNHNNTHFL